MFNNTIKKNRQTLKICGLVATTLFSLQALAMQCEYQVSSEWSSGFTGSISITNDNTTAINNWQVAWSYDSPTNITNIWQAELLNSNPFQAAGLGWNSLIEPGDSVTFGFQGEGSNAMAAILNCGYLVDEETEGNPDDGDSDSDSDSDTDTDTDTDTDNTPGLSAIELTQQMGVGWNAGNSLDAVGGETAWGNPLLNQALFDAVRAAGFKTVRLPVAWSQFSDENNFIIKQSWMDRVEEVVNYALNADLYVVMNMHWDGGWMQPTYAQQEYVNNRIAIMWQQIATQFKDYDHRLLFAGTNEVMVEGDYGTPTNEYYSVQNSFNQAFVTAVRDTGGNNAQRFLVVQGFNTNIDHAVNFAQLPTDSANQRLMMEVHYYDPYNFTLNENSEITQWGAIATDMSKTESWANETHADSQFQKMKAAFVDQGVGVILGEYGVISRLNVADHETYRVYWNKYITQSAREHQIMPIYWDNGYSGDKGLGIFDRNSGAQLNPDLIEALVK